MNRVSYKARDCMRLCSSGSGSSGQRAMLMVSSPSTLHSVGARTSNPLEHNGETYA